MFTEKVQKIIFKGLDFILTTPEDENSPITTIEDYQQGKCSYAHFWRSTGIIRRFGQQVGSIDDIEFGEFIEIEVDEAECLGGLLGDSWLV